MLHEDHSTALQSLIDYLELEAVMPANIAASKNKDFMRRVSSGMIATGSSFGEAAGTMPHLNRPDAKDYLRSIDNNLVEQVNITRANADAWFAHGEHPAPH